MHIQRRNYPELRPPVGPYVQAVKHGHVLYLSGLTAFDTEARHGNIAQQASAIFRQIEVIATAEGSGLDNLIKVTIFVTSLDDLDELRQTLFAVYGAHLPASSLVQVAGLFAPELKIEIEAIIGV